MSKLILLPALVLALFIGSAVARPASDAGAMTDIRVLFQSQTDPINKGDLDAVMALYADDALVTGNAVCATPCNGIDPHSDQALRPAARPPVSPRATGDAGLR